MLLPRNNKRMQYVIKYNECKGFFYARKSTITIEFQSHDILFIYIIRNYKLIGIFDKNLYTYLVSFSIYNHVQYIT